MTVPDKMTVPDSMRLPDDLPAPLDDGAAAHLPGTAMPTERLPATTGELLDLPQLSAGRRLIVYTYPRTGRPGEAPLTPDWDLIPGARGCTPETCAFRDHHAEIRAAGAEVVGLSTQDTDYQREVAERLHLPFPLVSDAELALTNALRLPTFEVAGHTLLRRLTLVVLDGTVEHVWYPVFPPDRHAEQVLGWLRSR